MLRLVLCSLLACSLSACRTQPIAPFGVDLGGGDQGPGGASDLGPVVGAGDPVDVLFVLGTNPGSNGIRQRLRESVAGLFEELGRSSRDWHVGFVTADLGVGAYQVAGCTAEGDGARLNPSFSTCASLPLGFMAGNLGGGTNFDGDAARFFSECYLGILAPGCAYQQPWAAAIAAIDPKRSGDAGFRLRPGGTLAVVMVTNVEDCSIAPGSDLFDPFFTPAFESEGPFRCVVEGATCAEGAIASPGTGSYSGCGPFLPDGKLLGTSAIEAALQQVRTVKSRVQLYAIAAPSTDVSVVKMGSTRSVASACQDPSGTFFGYPAVRLAGYGATVEVGSVCAPSYADFLGQIGANVTAP